MSKELHWVLEDHICRSCSGRILRCVRGGGITGGGNPIYKCADCGASSSALGPSCLCWCGFHQKFNNTNPYMCIPYSFLKDYPKKQSQLLIALHHCGCDPEKGGEVGIISSDRYVKIMNEKEI